MKKSFFFLLIFHILHSGVAEMAPSAIKNMFRWGRAMLNNTIERQKISIWISKSSIRFTHPWQNNNTRNYLTCQQLDGNTQPWIRFRCGIERCARYLRIYNIIRMQLDSFAHPFFAHCSTFACCSFHSQFLVFFCRFVIYDPPIFFTPNLWNISLSPFFGG